MVHDTQNPDAPDVTHRRRWLSFALALALGTVCLPQAVRAEGGADVAIMPFDRRQLDVSLSETLSDTFQVVFAQSSHFSVVNQSDIANLVGFEKTKELMGCDSGSCLAEIGGALGVRFIVNGRFAKVGQSYLVIVKLMDTKNGSVVAQDQETIPAGDEQRLLDGVQRLAKRFGEAAAQKTAPLLTARAQPAAPSPKATADAALAPAAVEKEGQPSKQAATPAASSGPRWWLASLISGGVALGTGVVSALGGGVLFLVGVAGSTANPQAGAPIALCGLTCGCLGCGACALGAGLGGLGIYLRNQQPAAAKTVETEDDDAETAPTPVKAADAPVEPAVTPAPAPAPEETPPAAAPAPSDADEAAPPPAEEKKARKKRREKK